MMRSLRGRVGTNKGPSMAERAQLGVNAKRQDDLEEVDTQPRTGVDTQPATPERPTDELRGSSAPAAQRKAPARNECGGAQQQILKQKGWGEKLEHLAKHLGHRRPHAKKQQRNRATIAAELLTEAAATKLARMTPTLACDQALLAVGAWAETANQRRNAVAALTAHYGRNAVGMVLSVIADALLDDVRDLGAVVAHRCRRLTTDRAQTAVAEHRRSWGLSRLLEAAREHAAA